MQKPSSHSSSSTSALASEKRSLSSIEHELNSLHAALLAKQALPQPVLEPGARSRQPNISPNSTGGRSPLSLQSRPLDVVRRDPRGLEGAGIPSGEGYRQGDASEGLKRFLNRISNNSLVEQSGGEKYYGSTRSETTSSPTKGEETPKPRSRCVPLQDEGFRSFGSDIERTASF